MPLKCPHAVEGDQGRKVCVCVWGGGLVGKVWGLTSILGRLGTRDSCGGITNAPVTFSVNEKEEVLIKENKLERDSYEGTHGPGCNSQSISVGIRIQRIHTVCTGTH